MKMLNQLIGRCLVAICDRVPQIKPALRNWGLRTRKEWFPNRVVRVQMAGGSTVKLPSFSQNYLSFELFWKGANYYEPITTLLVQELSRKGCTFIDLGANIGYYSLVIAASQPETHVISFEPNPKNYALLRRNVEMNKLANVRCEPMGISDRNGTATLYLSASDMSASLRSNFEDHTEGETQVATTTLDSYLAQHPPVSPLLIKVDVEGHEDAFYRGAQATLAEFHPDIITEVALSYGRDSVLSLQKLGYRFYQITDQGLIESPVLEPVVRGRLVFLNYLLSARPREQVSALFHRIAPAVEKLDLSQTSKYLSPEAVRKFEVRSSTSAEATQAALV